MPPPPTPFVLPRALIFLASIWLIGSWMIAIGFKPPVQPSSMSYEWGLEMMLMCLTTGLMIGWPLLRLSQVASAAPIRQTLLDLMVMLSMAQVILWPLRLVTTWTPPRTAAISITLAGWTILAGAIVAAAIGTGRRGPRNLAMLACVSLCLLGPALGCIGLMSGVDAMALIDLSPIMAVRTLGAGGSARITPDQWRWISVLYVAAAAAWTALVICTAARPPRPSPTPSTP